MRLAALFSGGKDSAYAVYRAIGDGHQVCCLLCAAPASADSHLLHHPGTLHTRVQARLMGIPYRAETASAGQKAEDHTLDNLVRWAVASYNIEGVVHGGIRSRYQLERFGRVCSRNRVQVVSPVWGSDAACHMRRVIKCGFRFVIQSVSAGGLDGRWLGKTIAESDMVSLERLAARHGFSVDFEGGEAETFVVDCPLFRHPIMLCGSPHWDGYVGRFEISEAVPLYHAR